MRMKGSEVGDWVRQIAGTRDHREVVSDDYLVLRPGPNFHWLMGMLDDTPAPALNRDGEPMTRDGFAHRLAGHVEAAARKAPSLAAKRVTPHVLRHSCAMHTLAATGDIRKVALWLGHASIQSTEHSLRADPTEKLAVLAAHGPPAIKAGRFRPPSDRLMAVLATARDPSASRR